MNQAFRYVVIAVVVVAAYWIISPSSLLGWVLYFVVGVLAVGAVEAAFRRMNT